MLLVLVHEAASKCVALLYSTLDIVYTRVRGKNKAPLFRISFLPRGQEN